MDQFRDALVVVIALAVAATVAILFGSIITIPNELPFSGVLDGLVAILGLMVAFFPVYYVFPDIDASVQEVVPGVLVAAIGWAGLEWLFHLYASVSNKPDIYGLAGILLLLVIWLYVGGLVLLAGATVNATVAGHDGDPTTQWHGKRQFGRQITDIESFEGRLNDLVVQATDATIQRDKIQRALQRQAENVEDSHNGGAATSAEDSAGSEQR